MLGGSSLRRYGAIARPASQRYTPPLRSRRLLSSVRTLLDQTPALPSLRNSLLTPNGGWKRGPSYAFKFNSSRFNSTSSAAASETVAPQSQSADPSDLSALAIEQIPEKIGYLKELGLDYGWGPSSIIQFLIEHIHIWTGLPWWASIAGTGLLVRLAIFKPTLSASDNGAKMQKLKGVTDPIRSQMLYHSRTGNSAEVMKARAKLQELYQKHDVKMWRSFVPLLQIPLGYGCFRVVRGMAALPVPGLAAESVAWLKDLTVYDPYFILPAAASGFLYLTFKKGGETGFADFQKTAFGKLFLYGLPAISFVFMSIWPSSLQLYFVMTGLFALGQAYLINSPGFRKFANLTVVPKPGSPVGIGGAISGPGGSRAGDRIRLIPSAIQAEAGKQKAEAAVLNSTKVSIIDRAVNSVKGGVTDLRRETVEKINEMSGQGPQSRADGTRAPPPRLSEKDLRLAEEYNQRRQQEDNWSREERNHARRESHLQMLKAEKEKAKLASLKR